MYLNDNGWLVLYDIIMLEVIDSVRVDRAIKANTSRKGGWKQNEAIIEMVEDPMRESRKPYK